MGRRIRAITAVITAMYRELRALLESQLKQRGRSMASVAAALGKSRAWLQRLLAGTRPLTVEQLETILVEIGTTPEEFLAEYLQQAQSPHPTLKSDGLINPAHLLRQLRSRTEADVGWLSAFQRMRDRQVHPAQ